MTKDRKALSKAEFERDAAEYDQSPKYATLRRSYQMIADEALERPFRMWLDVGCGTGALLQMVGRQNRDAMLSGVDLSDQMIHVARSRLGENADLTVSDSEELPFDSGHFDLVTCTFSFHHYPNPQRVVREMARVLAPGGRVIIADPSPFFPVRELLNLAAPFREDGTVRFYSKGEMADLVESAGLVVSRWSKLNWHSFLMVADRVRSTA